MTNLISLPKSPIFSVDEKIINELIAKRDTQLKDLAEVLSILEIKSSLHRIFTLDEPISSFSEKRKWAIDSLLWTEFFELIKVDRVYETNNLNLSNPLDDYRLETYYKLSEVAKVLPFTPENISEFIQKHGTASAESKDKLSKELHELVEYNFIKTLENNGAIYGVAVRNTHGMYAEKTPNNPDKIVYSLKTATKRLLTNLWLCASALDTPIRDIDSFEKSLSESQTMDDTFAFSLIDDFSVVVKPHALIIQSEAHISKFFDMDMIT